MGNIAVRRRLIKWIDESMRNTEYLPGFDPVREFCARRGINRRNFCGRVNSGDISFVLSENRGSRPRRVTIDPLTC